MVTLKRAKEFLRYDADTGFFWWISQQRTGPRHILTRPAGTPHSQGYVTIYIDGMHYKAHRLAWLFAHGDWPPNEIDHANGKRSDNRIVNLRLATREQNMRNTLRRSKAGILRGARPIGGGRWRAKIQIAKKSVHLGCFASEGEAHAAYLAAARAHFGEFATAGPIANEA